MKYTKIITEQDHITSISDIVQCEGHTQPEITHLYNDLIYPDQGKEKIMKTYYQTPKPTQHVQNPCAKNLDYW